MRCRDARAPDRTTAAADVLYNHGLTENCSHLLGHDARHHIARTSGGERHHHGDRSCRVIVLWPRRRRDTDADGRDAEEANERYYEELSAPHRTNRFFDHPMPHHLEKALNCGLPLSLLYHGTAGFWGTYLGSGHVSFWHIGMQRLLCAAARIPTDLKKPKDRKSTR